MNSSDHHLEQLDWSHCINNYRISWSDVMVYYEIIPRQVIQGPKIVGSLKDVRTFKFCQVFVRLCNEERKEGVKSDSSGLHRVYFRNDKSGICTTNTDRVLEWLFDGDQVTVHDATMHPMFQAKHKQYYFSDER